MFDLVPACLVLREPNILGQLAMLRFRPGTTESMAAREKDWRTWGALGVRLLTRTFDPGQTVIVKAPDVCNTMADVILANDSRSKAVLLSVNLRTFILSVLKLENRKEWTRKRADFWSKTMTMFPALNEVNVLELDDAHKAAYIWLVTACLWNWLQKQTDGRRLLLMDGEEVSEDPGNTLKKLAAFFGLPLEDKCVSQILASPLLTRHAKFPGQTYGADERRNDLADWERRFGDEADRAVGWAASLQQKLEADGVGLSAMAGPKHQEIAQ
jgi:Sulfotransferase domain